MELDFFFGCKTIYKGWCFPFTVIAFCDLWNHGEALQPCKCPCALEDYLVDTRGIIRPFAKMLRYLLGALYTVSPVDLFPAGRLDAIEVFDYFAIALIFILYIVGLYCRRQRLQHVRQLAADLP
ncbi:hypothetical protein LOK49_LG12G00150 [Camellia lanceoleosa]|uniref:Uncharacterized protein n=1 Tax=Camellia lanceoleosa TaxID=1840588 RepID=A0ACC0FZ67_9ERIC|nr:hypothetical protein LOK49_LG12G00150 [Camellia lanceoleosa]